MSKLVKPQINKINAVELANLAATLAPSARNDHEINDALNAAMRFHVAASLFVNVPAHTDDLIFHFGSETERRKIREAAFEPILKDTLELNPEADTDAVREYLKKHGINLKQARSVLANIRIYIESTHRTAAPLGSPDHQLNEMAAPGAKGSISYKIPKNFLNAMIRSIKNRRQSSANRGHKTRQKKS